MHEPEMASEPPQFSQSDLERLKNNVLIGEVIHHHAVGSTNDWALQNALSYHGRLPLAVITERQTAGRGRGANRWWAQRGALTFSLLIDATSLALPMHAWPKASLITGLAVCEALDSKLAPTLAGLKWPNDVWVEGRKLCGILVEAPRHAPHRLVVGIGVNVNNSATLAPSELQSTAVALCDVIGKPTPLVEVVEAIVARLAYWLPRVTLDGNELYCAWKQRCVLEDRRVAIDQGLRRIAGKCLGIDADGALQVETDGGIERCYSGIVNVFPPEDISPPPLSRP